MAKVRVYELAKELNIENKALVEKLKAGGLDIKNYMSTLDEEDARKARDIVEGVTSEVIEEKRIKPRVIRRRKKTVTVEAKKSKEKPEEKEPGEVPEEIEEEKEAIEEKKETKKAKQPSKKKKEEKPTVKEKEKAKKTRKKKLKKEWPTVSTKRLVF